MKLYYPDQVAGRVRDLCIRKNWFTCGSSRQYDRMFDMLDRHEDETGVYVDTIYVDTEAGGEW